MCRWFNGIDLDDNEDFTREGRNCPDSLHEEKERREAEILRNQVKCYWENYIALLNRVGEYASAYKLAINAGNGIFPTQVVRYDYYKGAANLDMAVAERKKDVLAQVAAVNTRLQDMGEKVLSQGGWKKFLNWAMTERRRTALRGKAQRSLKKGVFMSPEELVNWYLERHPEDNFIETFRD